MCFGKNIILVGKTFLNIIIITIKFCLFLVIPNGISCDSKNKLSDDSLDDKLKRIECRWGDVLENQRKEFKNAILLVVLCIVISFMPFFEVSTKTLFWLLCIEMVYLLFMESNSLVWDSFIILVCIIYFLHSLVILLKNFSVFNFFLTLLSLFFPLICAYNQCLRDKKNMKCWFTIVVATIFFIGGSLIAMGICQMENFLKAETLMKKQETDELKIATDRNFEAWSQYEKKYNSDDMSNMGDFIGKMILIGYENFFQEQPVFFEKEMLEKSRDNDGRRERLIVQIGRSEGIVRGDNTWSLVALIFLGYKWIVLSIAPIVILAYWKR